MRLLENLTLITLINNFLMMASNQPSMFFAFLSFINQKIFEDKNYVVVNSSS